MERSDYMRCNAIILILVCHIVVLGAITGYPKGTLEISTSKRNTEILLNGIPIGVGNATVDNLAPGFYVVVGRLEVNDSTIVEKSDSVEVFSGRTTKASILFSGDDQQVEYQEGIRPFIFSIGVSTASVFRSGRRDAGAAPTVLWTIREKFSAEVSLIPLFFSTSGIVENNDGSIPTQFYILSRFHFQKWLADRAVAFGGGLTAGGAFLGYNQEVLDSIDYTDDWWGDGTPVTHTELQNDVYWVGPSLLFRFGSNRIGLRTTYDLMFGTNKVAHIFQFSFLVDL